MIQTTTAQPRLAIFTTDFMEGGVGRMMVELAIAFADEGYAVDFVCDASAAGATNLESAGVRVHCLAKAVPLPGRFAALRAAPRAWRVLALPVLLPIKTLSTLAYLPALARYLARERPAFMLAAKTECNVLAVWALERAGTPTRLAISERNMIGEQFRAKARPRAGRHKWGRWHKWRWRHLAPLMHAFYPRADAIIAISEAVAAELAVFAGLERRRISIAPNPAFSQDIVEKSKAPLTHPWFAANAPPVILYVGRLSRQKSLDTLLHAFARLPAHSARLMLVGDGRLKEQLQALARRLGIDENTAWVGTVANPFAYMSRAGVFVLPSIYEGFGNVLIEAMGCGCPVIATDCPGAPAEIVGYGQYGPVVPAGDAPALAEAIKKTLGEPADKQKLIARARDFSVDNAVRRYGALLSGALGDSRVL